MGCIHSEKNKQNNIRSEQLQQYQRKTIPFATNTGFWAYLKKDENVYVVRKKRKRKFEIKHKKKRKFKKLTTES